MIHDYYLRSCCLRERYLASLTVLYNTPDTEKIVS